MDCERLAGCCQQAPFPSFSWTSKKHPSRSIFRNSSCWVRVTNSHSVTCLQMDGVAWEQITATGDADMRAQLFHTAGFLNPCDLCKIECLLCLYKGCCCLQWYFVVSSLQTALQWKLNVYIYLQIHWLLKEEPIFKAVIKILGFVVCFCGFVCFCFLHGNLSFFSGEKNKGLWIIFQLVK